MRPLRITLDGFSAYRARQTLSLEDVEFFSLSGPTGSGKSSLIDAMIFALYGRVPRLGGRAVAPVITAGADRARVSFEFEVSGDTYVVSRVAERTDSGASVREARLETADGSPVASGAGEVTREVEDLLRLRFDDFTKTVVLPQGEFARFLKAGSTERRDLLRDLLGLDVYARLRELATERRSEASGRAGSARSQLEALEVPATEDLAKARARLVSLRELSDEIRDQLDELEKVETGLQVSEQRIDGFDEALRRLGDIAPPEHLEQLNHRLATSSEAESEAEEALEQKRVEADKLKNRIEALPTHETISNTRLAHEELARIDERIAALDVDEARADVKEAEKSLRRAETELTEAREAADGARVSHAAHTVSTALVVGEPCPVCAQMVDAVPNRKAPPELTALDEAVAAARTSVESRREAVRSSQARLTELETRGSELGSQRESLAKRVASALSLEELAEAEEKLTEQEGALQTLTSEIGELEAGLRRARRDHEDAAEAVRSVADDYVKARETVADLKPPYPDSDDPMVRWKEFVAWRDEATDEVTEQRQTLLEALESERDRLAEMRQDLVSALDSVGVPDLQPYDVTVARELEVARSQVATMEDVIERSETLQEQLDEATRAEAVAGALANHLRANGFERWLMAGAITGLVNGANDLLSQLSGGGYSLESDEDGDFRIIDHRNADEVRDVNTLSGGETFLVSLALSLSLAETLSAAGGTGLDAIILDEGFGTLDEESLDVVAAVLEELAGRGLMVGVITHVKELAARAPVRYRVTREPEGSRVEVVS